MYPKDFKFTGWHPHCRCHAVTVLKTEDEMAEDTRRILDGKDPLPSEESENAVVDVPEGFDDWIANNASRTALSSSVPYFMLDNPTYVADSFAKSTGGNRTSFATDMLQQMPYFQAMTQRDPRVAAIYSQLDDGAWTMSDIEKTMLLSKVRGICGQLTYVDLKQRGLIGEDWVMCGVDRNFVVQQGGNYATSTGKSVSLKDTRMDMVVVRDASGKQFAYPVGAKAEDAYFAAKTASEVIAELPPVLQVGIKRLSFYPMECPAAPYWRVEYKNPSHVSAMTDGGMTSVWKCSQGYSRDTFKELLSHEAGHILDDHIISASAEWQKAVQADLDFYRANKYPVLHNGAVSKYGSNNACEDFAESMRMFINERGDFKVLFPHREGFLSRLLKGR